MQHALVVVQPEQQGTDHRARPVLVPAEARHHAVGGALVLHLHHRPLSGAVAAVQALGHDTVQTRAFEAVEPVQRQRPVGRGRRQVHRRPDTRQQLLQPLAAIAQRHLAQIAIALCQQIPQHDRRRRLLGQHRHARSGRVDPLQESVEVQPARPGDDDLAVQDSRPRQRRLQRRQHLGEVPVQRLAVTALQVDAVRSPEHQHPEAVPFRLVQPPRALGQRISQLREHGLDGRRKRRAHFMNLGSCGGYCNDCFEFATTAGFRHHRPAGEGTWETLRATLPIMMPSRT
jgi:hypothetical protein